MAFIRRVRTKSGATAVQIAEYTSGRRQRIVAHVGSAHTQAELGVLLERARGMLADPGQLAMEIGVDAAPVVTGLAGAAQPPALFPIPGRETDPLVRDAPGRVVGTDSRALYDALSGVYRGLGFDVLADAVFADMVIARIVEPTSMLDSGRVLADLGRSPASYATMKRALYRASKDIEEQGTYRSKVAKLCFEHASTCGDVTLCLYDVTTLYFEAEKEDDLRKVGYSKERRVDPQIVVGLLVDRDGFPLEIGCFDGKRAETTTILPIVKGFQERHGLADMVIVADAGMLSASNLRELDQASLRFIVGSRVTKAPVDLASHFRWHGDAFTDGQIIDTITPKTGTKGENNPLVRGEPVWDPAEHPKSWRAVWAYSKSRAARDRRTLGEQEKRARAIVEGDKAAHPTRFVKTTKDARTLDQAALNRAQQLVGLKGYLTNITVEQMAASQVIGSYHDLWHVEQSFRMSKTDLQARPMFVRTRDAIEAHLTIVFTALAVSREAQNRTGLAIGNLVKQLRPLRSATIAINGTSQTFAPAIPPEKQAIIDSLARPKITH